MEKEIILNIVELDNRFLNEVTLSKINIKIKDQKKIPYNLRKRILLVLRSNLVNSVIFLQSNILYGSTESLNKIKNLSFIKMINDDEYEFSLDNSTIYFSFSQEKLSFNEKNLQSKLIFKLLIGEMIASKFRNFSEYNYAVEVTKNAIFRAISTDPQHIFDKSEHMDHFKPYSIRDGFIFEPIIDEENRVLIVIDPRYKFSSDYSFRKIITDNQYTIEELNLIVSNEETIVIDKCPITTCKHNQTSNSQCLIGSNAGGKFVNVEKLEKINPTKKMIDILDYHNNLCIEPDKPLVRHIQDEPPIAIIKSGFQKYTYLIERLFFEPRFTNLNKSIRNNVMDKIRPQPNDRFLLTKEFARRLDEVKLDDLPSPIKITLLKSTLEKNKPWSNFNKLSRPKLIGLRGSNYKAINLLKQYQTLDLNQRDFNKIIIQPIIQNNNKNISDFFQDLCNGNDKIKFPGIKSLFGIDVKLEKAKQTIESSTNVINNDEQICNVKLLEENEKLNENVDYLKANIQRIKIDTIQANIRNFSKIRGILYNVALGIYAKLGGVPWMIQINKYINSIFYIGISLDFYGNKRIYSINITDNNGKWIRGIIKSVDKENYSESLFDELSLMISDLEINETTDIIIHKNGQTLDKLESHIPKKLMERFGKNCKIVWCSIKKSPIRFYQLGGDEGYIAADLGTYVRLNKSSIIIQLSSSARVQGTPNPILIEQLFPITPIDDNRAKEVFNLSFMNFGYADLSTVSPITTRYAQKALSKLNFKDVTVMEFNRPWFI